jgi:nicotinamide-nucleotide amidase
MNPAALELGRQVAFLAKRRETVAAEIISTGQEIIEGRVIDTNTAFAARELLKAGISVQFCSAVGDDRERLLTVLQTALARSDIVIISGGLGPTEDDLTREVCASALGVKLIHCKSAQHHIRKILARYNRVPNPAELRQAYFPACNTKIIPNRTGTARGFICEKNSKILAALSGVPSEFSEMMLRTVLPFLKKRFAHLEPQLQNTFNTIGKSESEVQRIALPILSRYKLSWGITAHQLVISLSVWASADEKGRFDAACKKLRTRLKSICFSEGEKSLQETVISALKERHRSVAVAESCTGGLILNKLTDVPGASEVLSEGVIAYSNDSKIRRLNVRPETLVIYGAVSEKVATEMAAGIRSSANASLGLATTGIAGPSGGTAKQPVGMVYIAVASRKAVKVRRFTFTGTRTDIKERAANAALSILLQAATKLRT